jgi:YtkA-like
VKTRFFKTTLFPVILTLVLVLAACKPQNAASGNTKLPAGIQVQLEVGDAPKTGNLPVSIYILKDNQALSGAVVSVTGNMTHAGMEPVIATATESEAGLYKAEPFVIEMPGDAVISADITLSDGTKFTVNKALTVAQSP